MDDAATAVFGEGGELLTNLVTGGFLMSASNLSIKKTSFGALVLVGEVVGVVPKELGGVIVIFPGILLVATAPKELGRVIVVFSGLLLVGVGLDIMLASVGLSFLQVFCSGSERSNSLRLFGHGG
ncbi:hypothetical protein BD770DRAFT_385851, partial [Pilaira anomala]